MQDDFSVVTGLATSILGPDGGVLTRSGWSDFCTEFHHCSTTGLARCLERGHVNKDAVRGQEPVLTACPHGLYSAAAPILVEGRHLATLVSGQVLLEPPDEDRFRAQAQKLGLDAQSYLMAVRRIPVMSKNSFLKLAGFLIRMAYLLASMGRHYRQQRALDDEVRRQKSKLEAIFQGSGDAMRIIGTNYLIQNQNRHMSTLSGVPKEDAIGRKCHHSFHHPFCGTGECILHRILSGEERVKVETEMSRADGEKVLVELIATPLRDETGKITGAIESFRDISTRRQIEERLRFLSMHDPLTGLYNRAFFEEEMKRLDTARKRPLSIIVADVDGLKIVNDTLGHFRGDQFLKTISDALRSVFRSSDCVARIGGDEFAVILPQTDHATSQSICQRIHTTLNSIGATNTVVPLSLSIGLATTNDPAVTASDLFKEADNNMYREKLLCSASVRNTTVQALMAALETRDFITEGHAKRLKRLVTLLGRAVCLSEYSMANAKLLAQFHDIGKVAVPERILFKNGPLTPGERREIERHCEIGHRIALSSPVLVPIADLILKHHEWWNGKGYPLALKGNDIPLECRILAIADAFDAMTSNRPYRQAMPREKAFQELQRCAGTQFDPFLTSTFITAVK